MKNRNKHFKNPYPHQNGDNKEKINKPYFPEEAKKCQAKVGVLLDVIKGIGAILVGILCLIHYYGKKTDDIINNKK
jgi:hypothetical protein